MLTKIQMMTRPVEARHWRTDGTFSYSQYEPLSVGQQDVAPLDIRALDFINFLSYDVPLGDKVDFTFHLNQQRRVHAQNRYLDPQKISTSNSGNSHIKHTVARFLTYVCKKEELSITEPDLCLQKALYHGT